MASTNPQIVFEYQYPRDYPVCDYNVMHDEMMDDVRKGNVALLSRTRPANDQNGPPELVLHTTTIRCCYFIAKTKTSSRGLLRQDDGKHQSIGVFVYMN